MKRCEIVGAWKVCHDYPTIVRALDVPYNTVRSVVKSFLRRGTVTRKKGSGRPRKTTPHSDRIQLQILEANVNGEKYCETIRKFLTDNPPPQNWIFQQDNAPAHTSRVVKNYFEEVGVRLLPWPSKSPDLNPIEHVWDFLGRKVAARVPMNLMQLRNFLGEEWNQIPQDYLNHLVEGMPRRINAVIEARGRHTKY